MAVLKLKFKDLNANCPLKDMYLIFLLKKLNLEGFTKHQKKKRNNIGKGYLCQHGIKMLLKLGMIMIKKEKMMIQNFMMKN